MSEEKQFVHLHVHTEYSLLDGLSDIKKIVKYAKSQNMNSLAITDHGAMFGAIDFYRACQKEGIKPIIGMEAYLARRSRFDRDPAHDTKPYHLLLLAKDQTGYQNLLKLASLSQLEGYYYRPRVDKELLEKYSQGLICTSGCLAAEIPRMIEDGKEEQAKQTIGWYADVFGRDGFFLELQHHDIPQLHTLNRWLVDNQGYARVPLIATNDVHYIKANDYDAQDTLLCIQTGALKNEQNRMRMTDPSYHLRSPEEMWQLFGDVPDALNNTLWIAEMCNVNLDSKGYHLPVFPVPEGFDAETYLRHLCEQGIYWRYGDYADSDPVIRDRLNYELDVIHTMGFDTYFLIVWDLCEFARHADIWWNVRGSGAGSVAAYCLGITSIDPLSNSLLFERFLNPGRVSMPDIDMDFPEDRRAEMIQYCAQKYGEDKVAAIITFGTMGSKAAIRDVGRAMDMPLPEVDRVARLIPTAAKAILFDDALGDDPEKAIPDLKQAYESDPTARKLIDAARELEGVTRHASTHAAGVIVADKPLDEYIPLHRVTSGAGDDAPVKQVTQFPMETCESIGLLKVDFLGLSTLTIMRRACDLIEQYHGIRYDLSNIPYRPDPDNPDITRRIEEMFKMLSRGETIGVFQLESQGMRRMLTDMRPYKFEHIVAAVALYRPGPMDYIPTYNRRLHGEEKVEFLHPKLEKILSETYGICVSGDSLVIDVETGQRHRVDQLAAHVGKMTVQGVDENYAPAVGRVTHLIDNGEKPVYRITLRNGASVKTTHDHRFLTENGWMPLNTLKVGNYVATPPYLIEPENTVEVNREKLRILAYLIADGSLASGCSVDFVNKEQVLLDEYVRCLRVFEDLEPVYTAQIHDVTRVGVRSRKYKSVNNLLAWMRELGFKYPPGLKHPRGVRSHEKSIPEFVFRLNNTELAFFVASLWDCDGYIDNTLCHYKTISSRLAKDVQTLLLRLGITSTIYVSSYESVRGKRNAYQVTIYETTRLSQLLAPHMLTAKRNVSCRSVAYPTIDRMHFIQEVKQASPLSVRQLTAQFGVARMHFTRKARETRPRIAVQVVASLADRLPLPSIEPLLNVSWQEIVSIEPEGIEHVYDLTVESIHNFVANNIVVHNCVYQEQIMQIGAELFGYSLGEADLMRRAVSKKKKEDLFKHRKTFEERGPEHGVDPETANKIFDDIEFFARYGFNKSHAADYAVLTCQTAYLKCHYPHEYMAALMSVHRDDSAKVSLFAADCNRMGIEVLPPNVNKSMVDFTIESIGKDKKGIRFGMGAVKNVGLGPCEHIIQCRADGGPFRNLDDFCHRVDMRVVQKRALESLIRVGALDEFAPRPVLVAAIDRILSFSADYHKAKDIGQMSLFGDSGSGAGVGGESILSHLPNVEKFDQREMLRWEKELVGLYVTDHPLRALAEKFVGSNFVNSADLVELGDAANGKAVRVAGLITNIRQIVTKKGDTMAILTLEDITGTVGAVLFPRSWEKFRTMIVEDRVVVVTGKADTTRGDVQIVVDEVSQNFESVTADGPELNKLQNATFAWMDNDSESGSESIVDQNVPAPVEHIPHPAPVKSSVSEAGMVTDREMPGWLEDEENGWHPQPDFVYDDEQGHLLGTKEENGNGNGNHTAPEAPAARPRDARDTAPAAPVTLRRERKAPAKREPEPAAQPGRLLVLTIERSGDNEKDQTRIRRLHGYITQFPGQDRFCFIFVGGGKKKVRMDFPQPIEINDEVLAHVDGKLGKECVEVLENEW